MPIVPTILTVQHAKVDTTSTQQIHLTDYVLYATIPVLHAQPNGINVRPVLLLIIELLMTPYVYALVVLISSLGIKQAVNSAMII